MTENQDRANSDAGRFPFYRLSVRQYLKMIDAGVFPKHLRLELLDGLLYENPDKKRPRPGRRDKSSLIDRPKSDPISPTEAHDYSVLALASNLHRVLQDNWLISEQRTIALGAWYCSTPDLVVLKGPVANYDGQIPAAPDVALIVEVAGASYPLELGVKWRRYATCGIPIYWIVNIAQRRLEVFSDPQGQGRSASYRTTEIYNETQSIPMVLDGTQVGQIQVRDMLPKA